MKDSRNHLLKRQQSGVALILVIWMLALLSIIAFAYINMSRTEIKLSSNLANNTRALAHAEAGFWTVIFDLIKPPKERQFPLDGRTITISPIQDSQLRIRIIDETGKIDLNKASAELLSSLLTNSGASSEQASSIVDAILDWRDRDQLKHTFGAEDDDYQAQGLGYGAKDSSFNDTSELRQILGMTEELYQRVKDKVTVHSMQARIRLSSASLSVLNSLPGFTPETAQEIVSLRSLEGTPDLVSILPDQTRPFVFTAGYGNTFTIEVEARVNGIMANINSTVLLKRTGNKPITILKWQENQDKTLSNTMSLEHDTPE